MKNAGSMTNSPWAKLIVCDVCHSNVKSDRDEGVNRPRRKAGYQELDEGCHEGRVWFQCFVYTS